MYNEEDEQVQVIRQHNRALRGVNRQLRRLLKRTQENADYVFNELCNTESEAEKVLEEIRTLCGLGKSLGNYLDNSLECDPDDYESVIEAVTNLVKPTHNIPVCLPNPTIRL